MLPMGNELPVQKYSAICTKMLVQTVSQLNIKMLNVGKKVDW